MQISIFLGNDRLLDSVSSVLHALAMRCCLGVSDEGAVAPHEANLCLIMEWSEGTALGKKNKIKSKMGTGEEE